MAAYIKKPYIEKLQLVAEEDWPVCDFKESAHPQPPLPSRSAEVT